MFKIQGTNITLTRGDSFSTQVNILNNNGTPYVPQEGEKVIFAVKRTAYDRRPVLKKEINLTNMTLELFPEDTQRLDFGDYHYDIRIIRNNGVVDTFITDSTFTVAVQLYNAINFEPAPPVPPTPPIPPTPPTPTYLYNWDFTESLIDSVQGEEATLYQASRTSSGVSIEGNYGKVRIGQNIDTYGKTVEIDIAYSNYGEEYPCILCILQNNSGYRIMAFNTGEHKFDSYNPIGNFYVQYDIDTTDKNFFSGSTVKFVFGESDGAEVYKNDVYVGHVANCAWGTGDLYLGNIAGPYYYNSVESLITGVRIYENEPPTPNYNWYYNEDRTLVVREKISDGSFRWYINGYEETSTESKPPQDIIPSNLANFFTKRSDLPITINYNNHDYSCRVIQLYGYSGYYNHNRALLKVGVGFDAQVRVIDDTQAEYKLEPVYVIIESTDFENYNGFSVIGSSPYYNAIKSVSHEWIEPTFDTING